MSTAASAADINASFSCAVKGLTASSPDNLKLGDSVEINLNYVEAKNRKPKNLSRLVINGQTTVGHAQFNPCRGAFPNCFIISKDNRMLAEIEISNSGNNARIKSLSLSKASGGWPVIATLSCTQN